jgi:hypothetical protein
MDKMLDSIMALLTTLSLFHVKHCLDCPTGELGIKCAHARLESGVFLYAGAMVVELQRFLYPCSNGN